MGLVELKQTNRSEAISGGAMDRVVVRKRIDKRILIAGGAGAALLLVLLFWLFAPRADSMTLPYPIDPNVEKALAKRGFNVVLNEYAVKMLGFKSPQDAVGKVVRSELLDPGTGVANINIIGVVGDSRFRTVRTPIDSIM